MKDESSRTRNSIDHWIQQKRIGDLDKGSIGRVIGIQA